MICNSCKDAADTGIQSIHQQCWGLTHSPSWCDCQHRETRDEAGQAPGAYVSPDGQRPGTGSGPTGNQASRNAANSESVSQERG